MKLFLRQIFGVLLFPLVAAATQVDDQWPSLAYLRSETRLAAAVAHMRVRDAEIVKRIGGYENWRVKGEVVEPFKGTFRQGDPIEFVLGAEAGLQKDRFLGDKIVFLQRNFLENEKSWSYTVLENSTLPYSDDRVQKLRMIKRSTPRNKPSAPQANGTTAADDLGVTQGTLGPAPKKARTQNDMCRGRWPSSTRTTDWERRMLGFMPSF